MDEIRNLIFKFVNSFDLLVGLLNMPTQAGILILFRLLLNASLRWHDNLPL